MTLITPDSPLICLRSSITMEEVSKLSLSTSSEGTSDWVVVDTPTPSFSNAAEDASAIDLPAASLDTDISKLQITIDNLESSFDHLQGIISSAPLPITSVPATESRDETKQAETIAVEITTSSSDRSTNSPGPDSPTDSVNATDSPTDPDSGTDSDSDLETSYPNHLFASAEEERAWNANLQVHLDRQTTASNRPIGWVVGHGRLRPQELRDQIRISRAAAVAEATRYRNEEYQRLTEAREGVARLTDILKEVKEAKRECEVARVEYEDVVEANRVESLQDEIDDRPWSRRFALLNGLLKTKLTTQN